MRWISASLTLALAAPLLHADEVRLHDGRVLFGAVTHQGERVVVATRDGPVELAADAVAAIRTDGQLRAELREIARRTGDGAFAWLQLARLAHRYALQPEMWAFLDATVEGLAQVEADAAVCRLADRFLATLEPDLLSADDRQLDPVDKIRALVRIARPGAGAGRCAAVAAALARVDGADAELVDQARRAALGAQRVAANDALLRRGGDAAQRTAWRNMLTDDDRDARRQIAAIAGRRAPAREVLQAIAPGFLSDAPVIRMRTAEAVAAVGDRDLGARLLAVVGPHAGTPRRADAGDIGVRAHMMATLQTSYIRDFDVEIAQAAAVANPVVDRVTSGVVLDVTVAAVVTQRVAIESAYRRALWQLIGADPGPDPTAWAALVRSRTDAAADAGDRG